MILAMMRIPPSLNGHGGSQRAWRLLKALTRIAPVHFVLLYRNSDEDASIVSLEPIRSMVESVTRIEVPEWRPRRRKYGVIPGAVFDLATMRSHEAPVISSSGLNDIAAQLPTRNADILFAGRLPTAVIAQALIDAEHLSAREKIVDFDDIMSRYRRREIARGMTVGGMLKSRVDVMFIERAEKRLAQNWNAVSVCTDEDVALLRQAGPASRIYKVPNVVQQDFLDLRKSDGIFRILFVGNLSFRPNVQGLLAFMKDSWPQLQERIRALELQIVGLNPIDEVRRLSSLRGVSVTANAPSLRSFYESSDAVIAPIFYGGGTRIKILEAIAYGRPVVSTTVGAEGLSLTDGQSVLIADDMHAFVDRLVELERSPALSASIVTAAKLVQERLFSPQALYDAVNNMVAAND